MSSNNPFRDLKVYTAETDTPPTQKGWSVIPVDCNYNAGGDFIFIGYTTEGSNGPITSINFKAYSDEQKSNPEEKNGWEWDPTDLNKDAGGKFVYMFWKRNETGKNPITGLYLAVTPVDAPIAILGYISIKQDLNQDAGGDFIWPYTTTI